MCFLQNVVPYGTPSPFSLTSQLFNTEIHVDYYTYKEGLKSSIRAYSEHCQMFESFEWLYILLIF